MSIETFAASTCPEVAVVVATLNPGDQLKACLESVWAQVEVNVKIYLVDGDSTDGAMDYVEANSARIWFFESKRDSGIYDAWNRALSNCSSDWVLFLGADDQLSHPRVLEQLVRAGSSHFATEIVTSKVEIVDENGVGTEIVGEPWSWDRHRIRQRIAHPGTLHRRTLFERFGLFNPTLKIVGDYEFLLRIGPSVKSAFVDQITVRCGDGGISRRDPSRVFLESRLVQISSPAVGPVAAWILWSWKTIKLKTKRALCGA